VATVAVQSVVAERVVSALKSKRRLV